MEAAWERRADFVRLTLPEINGLLAGSDVEATSFELIAEGKANTNYRVKLADGSTIVLRLYNRDPSVGELEAAVLSHVEELVPVPRLLFHDSSRHLSELEWKPGATMESLLLRGEEAEVVSAAEDIGRALAAISSITFPAAGFLGPRLEVVHAWPSTVDGLFGYLRQCLAGEKFVSRVDEGLRAQIDQVLDDWIPRLKETVGKPVLVHGDFKASNLLIHEGRLSAVLDWEFVHSGTWLMSVGQLFRHPLPKGFEEGFLRGFGEVPPDWSTLARIVDLVSLVDFLNRDYAGPNLVHDVTSLIRRTVEGAMTKE